MKQLRGELQDAIRLLPIQADEVLHATYTSNEDTFFDVENVLFYNVGTGCFAKIGSAGLSFERSFARAPKPPQPMSEATLHHHRYEIVSRSEALNHWERRETLASWTVPSMPLRPQPSAALVWLGMKDGDINNYGGNIPSEGFGMTVNVHAPPGTVLNVSAVMKPLLDGIIAAFHSHDGSALEDVSNRLASRLATRPELIARALMDSKGAVLGPRRLLHPFQRFVQWNPADDLLVAANVRVDRIAEERPWSLSGELYSVRSKNSARLN